MLFTPRLVLRRLTAADAEHMYAHWASDAEVTRFLTWPPHASIDVTRKVLGTWVASYASDDFYQWGIVLTETSELVGTISVVNLAEDINEVEIGYCLGRAWWGKGIMTEALGRVITFFFDEVGANRVCAKHDVENSASGAVMAKCGMLREGTLRQRLRNKGRYVDVALYAILRDDYLTSSRGRANR